MSYRMRIVLVALLVLAFLAYERYQQQQAGDRMACEILESLNDPCS